MGMENFQINLRSVYGLHVPHFIVQSGVCTALVLTRPHPALVLDLTWSQSLKVLVLSQSQNTVVCSIQAKHNKHPRIIL